jgi:hypothetical protein
MPNLKPGDPVRVRGGTFVKMDGGVVAVHYPNTIGHLWHDKADVSPDVDVSELVEALRHMTNLAEATIPNGWRDEATFAKAYAALAKFEAAND